MEVILIDDVFNLGKRGEVVRVADGYGRNYLIPKKLAIVATPGNLKIVEQQRMTFAKKEAKYKEEAQILAQELNQLHLRMSRKAGETGLLFGSVTAKDIADLLEQNGIHLDRRRIILHQPIKNIGNYRVEAYPHSEVAAELLISVLVESDEPVARVKKKDEETDRIVAELDAKIKEIEQLTGSRVVEEPVKEPEKMKEPEKKPRPQKGEKREQERQKRK